MRRKNRLRLLIAALLIAVFYSAAAHPQSTLFPQTVAHAASGSTTFAVVGDYGSDSSHEASVASLISGWNPAFIATVGDNFYNAALDSGDTGNKYHESVGKYYCSYLAAVAGAGTCPTGGSSTNRFFPAMGNHDYSDGTLATYTTTSPCRAQASLPATLRATSATTISRRDLCRSS